jgi:hypothetical protein
VSRPIRSVGEVEESAGARARSIPPGSALTAAGEAVNQVEKHLRRVAAAYGAPAHV